MLNKKRSNVIKFFVIIEMKEHALLLPSIYAKAPFSYK